jgi:RNA polymerase-binding transcription factor DksA
MTNDDLTELSDTLDAVEAAMRRLDAGSYGLCEECGGSIDDERLSADPTVARCSSCTGAVPMIDLGEVGHDES